MLEHFSNANSQNTEINDLLSSSSVLEMLMMSSGDVKPEPDDHIIITDSSSLWPSDDFARILNYGNVSEFHHPHLPRTISCPPNMVLIENNKGRESFKKRKADERPPSYSKVAAEEKSQEKKLKGGCVEGDQSKITKQYNNNCKSTNTATCSANSNTNKNNNKQSADNNNKSKENSKASEAPKPDYIHVRARRGQATDSHSLAERVRREKISERMRYLQDLVPGCNKVTGKAGMLDEIINYVQSLQKQVEFLSMKLAAMNPSPIDFDVDSYLGKEVYTSNIPTVGASSSSANSHHQLQFNELMSSQGISCSNVGTGISNIHHQDLTTLRRTTSAPVSLIPDAFLDSPCLNQLPWDDDLQNLYTMELQQAGRSTAFMSQQFTGFFDAGHVKQEM